ncbi:hypothetical protein E2C01_076003 [Portunus trituberculatus]|uniref:Uncharacterized protein n=1 Tax=Portunus trituberculatus TaxID=210409 RepID=A0A5B7IHT3_PORTR|nr:hypothetical protein [Portunus trituberculatus]
MKSVEKKEKEGKEEEETRSRMKKTSEIDSETAEDKRRGRPVRDWFEKKRRKPVFKEQREDNIR